MYNSGYLWGVLWLGLVLVSCRQDAPTDRTPDTATPAEEPVAPSPPSPEVQALVAQAQGLTSVDVRACALLDAPTVAGILGLDAAEVEEAEAYHQPNKSTCIWYWNGGDRLLTVRFEFNDFQDRVKSRYANYFKQLRDEGEWAEPPGLQAGTYRYRTVAGPGDESIWSAEVRSFKWRLGNSYFLTANFSDMDEAEPQTAEADLQLLRRVAERVTAQLSGTSGVTK